MTSEESDVHSVSFVCILAMIYFRKKNKQLSQYYLYDVDCLTIICCAHSKAFVRISNF